MRVLRSRGLIVWRLLAAACTSAAPQAPSHEALFEANPDVRWVEGSEVKRAVPSGRSGGSSSGQPSGTSLSEGSQLVHALPAPLPLRLRPPLPSAAARSGGSHHLAPPATMWEPGARPLVVATGQRCLGVTDACAPPNLARGQGGGSRTKLPARNTHRPWHVTLRWRELELPWGCMGESHNAHDRQHAERAGRKVGGVP